MANQKIFSRSQKEKLEHAMDLVHDVQLEIEETGKHKRIINKLDKIVGMIYEIYPE